MNNNDTKLNRQIISFSLFRINLPEILVGIRNANGVRIKVFPLASQNAFSTHILIYRLDTWVGALSGRCLF